MKRIAALALVAGLAGCSEAAPTRIDGSSPQAFERTTTAARRDLPVADRLMFDSAIATMPARRYADHDPQAKARIAFDGMTAADVVATERERAP
jgi:PBP1b-binding outer membrane lipoprotein LpoB